MPKRIYSTSVKPTKAKTKKRMKSNTRYWEDQGDNDGMADAVNPKPKFRVRNLEDPKKVKRKTKAKVKAKAKDPKRGLKTGEMRGTTAQRKSAFNKISKKRTERKQRASARYTKNKY
jgi:hypothetical protein